MAVYSVITFAVTRVQNFILESEQEKRNVVLTEDIAG